MVVDGAALGAIGFKAGTPVPIERAAAESPVIDFLKQDGFVSFRESAAGVAEMAGRAVKDCLAKGAIDPDEIDTVLFSTESFGADPLAVRNAVLTALFDDCGLRNAHVQACWTNECANLSSVLSLARALVVSGSSRAALAVVSDRQDAGLPRLMANGASVMSDVAAAALITPETDAPLLRHVVTHGAPEVFAAERTNDVQRKTQAMMAALRSFADRIEAVTGRPPAGYPLVLTDNLHSMYLNFICDGLGLDPAQTRQPSKRDYAHGFSLDGLLGLDALPDWPDDGPVAILNVIPWSFGFTVLEKR